MPDIVQSCQLSIIHSQVQVLAVDESPPVQDQFGSTVHVELHPSASSVFPSSQDPITEGSITLPSPHISVQLLAFEGLPPEQAQPDSTKH